MDFGRTRRRTTFATGIVIGLAACYGASAPAAAQDLTIGRMLASQCAQCHGTDGRSSSEIDSLAGKSFSELYNELRDMKRDNGNDLMHLQAKGYTDAQLALIAEYFASLPKGGGGGGRDGEDEASESEDREKVEKERSRDDERKSERRSRRRR